MSKTSDIFTNDFSSKEALIERLKNETKVLRSDRVEAALKNIDRKNFVEKDYAIEAYEDYPLPIRGGQTISQPTTVVFMLELLDVQPGQKVLDIGSGSGYTSALLSEFVGEGGQVIGLEIVPELVEFGRENTASFDNVEIRKSKGGIEDQPEAPFDRILMSAGADDTPDNLIEQLKVEGVAVLPVGKSLMKITKKKDGKLTKEQFEGFAFVPFKEGSES